MRAYRSETWIPVYPHKPPVSLYQEVLTKNCRRCGAEFQTRSRLKKRCDLCQSGINDERQKEANEKLRQKRRARRLGAIL